jgi:hypothetical protein
MRLTLLLLMVLVLVSCKKKQREGSYAGSEDLYISTVNDTISSTFPQSTTVKYLSGSKCDYASSTVNYEFSRSDKVKTGYDHNESGTFIFSLEFKEDSLIASYYKDWLGEKTNRTFRGVKQ